MRKNISFRDTAQHKRALEKLRDRDRKRYKTEGDYITAAILAFESRNEIPITREEVNDLITAAIQQGQPKQAGGDRKSEEFKNPNTRTAKPQDVTERILQGHIVNWKDRSYAVRLEPGVMYRFADKKIIIDFGKYQPAQNINWQDIKAATGETRTDPGGNNYIMLQDGTTGEAWTWQEGQDRPTLA